MTKRILLSECGNWGEELIEPLETFDGAGYQVDFATQTGKRPVALPPSMDRYDIDPPLGRSVTSPEVAHKVNDLEASDRLDNPTNLSTLFPEWPYPSSHNYQREQQTYFKALDAVPEQSGQTYDAILIVGGSGPIVDLVDNQQVHDLTVGVDQTGKPVAAECYGVACLAFARDQEDRESILSGKHVTGHYIEYDYQHATGFMGTDYYMGPPPYPLEYILRDATPPRGRYIGNLAKETSVIVDYPFITGRSTPDSHLTGQKVVEVLENGLRQWGFHPASAVSDD